MPKPKTAAPPPPLGERVSVTVSSPVIESFRVAQLSGMFDVPLAERAGETFEVELPRDDDDWQIGLVVGPSGSGKSTVSNHRWGDAIFSGAEWQSDRAVLDCFPEPFSVKDITAMLTSVGFSSPPNWLRPYHVLSNGEKFRCDLARRCSANRSLQEPSRSDASSCSTSSPASSIARSRRSAPPRSRKPCVATRINI